MNSSQENTFSLNMNSFTTNLSMNGSFASNNLPTIPNTDSTISSGIILPNSNPNINSIPETGNFFRFQF